MCGQKELGSAFERLNDTNSFPPEFDNTNFHEVLRDSPRAQTFTQFLESPHPSKSLPKRFTQVLLSNAFAQEVLSTKL